MKIAIVGSREFKEDAWYSIFREKILPDLEFSKRDKILDSFISGGAVGVDSYIERWCKENEVEIEVIKPEWEKYGKRAGFLRNELIINEADKVIAFWDGQSKGTKHSIDLAIKAGKPIDIYVRS
jgi:hypothetical protein